MNWGRAKTILIILFLAIDLLLLGLLCVVNNDVNYIEEKTAQDTCAVLENHNIHITRQQIPLKRADNIVLNFENLTAFPEKIVERFLGDMYAETESGYVKESESISLKEGKFFYENNREISPFGSFNQIKKHIFSDMKKFGFKEKELSIGNGFIENGVYYAQVLIKYDGKKVIGTEINMEADAEGVRKLNGRIFDLKKAEKTGDKRTDITALLCNMIYNPDYFGMKIENISDVYYIASEYIDGAEVYAESAYAVCADNGRLIVLK